MIISCKTSSPVVKSEIQKNQNEAASFNLVEHQMHLIDSYISKIDTKANDNKPIDMDELVIHNNVRKITANEFKKDVVLKNKDIVRVKYKNHLHNNFIKSSIFYYDKDELVCIKIMWAIRKKEMTPILSITPHLMLSRWYCPALQAGAHRPLAWG